MRYVEYLETLQSCPFCGQTRDRWICDNETAFLTYSFAPYHKDHLLVIPKKHRVQMSELSDIEEGDIVRLKKTALSLLQKAGYANISILTHGVKDRGISVPHLHYDVIPNISRYEDGVSLVDRRLLTEEERDAVYQKFIALL